MQGYWLWPAKPQVLNHVAPAEVYCPLLPALRLLLGGIPPCTRRRPGGEPAVSVGAVLTPLRGNILTEL